MDNKETIAIIGSTGLFTEKPSVSGLEDIICYMVTRDSYARAEDADGDPVKRYKIEIRITVEEIK